MKSWYSTVQSRGYVGNTARILYAICIVPAHILLQRLIGLLNTLMSRRHLSPPWICLVLAKAKVHSITVEALSTVLHFSAKKTEKLLITDCLRLHSCFCNLHKVITHNKPTGEDYILIPPTETEKGQENTNSQAYLVYQAAMTPDGILKATLS